MAYTLDNFQGVFSSVATFSQQGNELYRDVLFAQFSLESANGTSRLFLDHNNMFGMKQAYGREQLWTGSVTYTTSSGEETFATFPSLDYSLQDRMNRDVQFGIEPPTTLSDISRYIGEIVATGYAVDPSYALKWLNKLSFVSPVYAGLSLIDDVQTVGSSVGDWFSSMKYVLFGIFGILIFWFVKKTFF